MALAGCEAPGPAPLGVPDYLGSETRLLDGELVNVEVRVGNTDDREVVRAYADCVAAQYALIRGYGFARHVRTQMDAKGGVWTGDAVYTISPGLPAGVRTIDAEVVVSNCALSGIPTV